MGDTAYGGSSANATAVKNAAVSFITALSNAGSTAERPRVYVNTFARDVRLVHSPSGTFDSDFTGANNAVNAIPFANPAMGISYNDYGPYIAGVGRGRTNWQGALDAVPRNAGVVVVVTDGSPTWWSGANSSTNDANTQEEDVAQAEAAANRLKDGQAQTRIVAVQIGQRTGSWERNLQRITGPTINSDYYASSYSGLATTLTNIANQACPKPNPRMTVTRSANVTTAAAGQSVTYTFTVKNTGNVALTGLLGWDSHIQQMMGCSGFGQGTFNVGVTCTITKTWLVPDGVSLTGTVYFDAQYWNGSTTVYVHGEGTSSIRSRDGFSPT